MVRIARDRVSILFGLAEQEAAGGHSELADRYVVLARKIGARYNLRLLPEYRERYCRSCSAYWVEGRTVRTRLRSGRRVRTCLRCGRERRTRLRSPRSPDRGGETAGPARDPGVPEPTSAFGVEEGEADSLEDEPEGP